MVFLSKSYGDGWRVFYPTNRNLEVHIVLKKTCMWGGSDKTDEVEGLEYKGYEFPTLEAATQAILAANPPH